MQPSIHFDCIRGGFIDGEYRTPSIQLFLVGPDLAKEDKRNNLPCKYHIRNLILKQQRHPITEKPYLAFKQEQSKCYHKNVQAYYGCIITSELSSSDASVT
ncbi:hypothetical protein MAR_029080 [Mya arenaria]|uniref:Uncharacterized protein n=1 Tax=Mya arenaria TaxID=6604 RepID=A0ABY7DI63_MYAAR|nr:hypothetical protein MAR_029080 [Mya arenaria]